MAWLCVHALEERDKHRQQFLKGAPGARWPVLAAPPAIGPKKWYRQTWFLVLTFFFFTPACLTLILSDGEKPTWLRVVAGVALTLCLIYLSMVMSAGGTQ